MCRLEYIFNSSLVLSLTGKCTCESVTSFSADFLRKFAASRAPIEPDPLGSACLKKSSYVVKCGPATCEFNICKFLRKKRSHLTIVNFTISTHNFSSVGKQIHMHEPLALSTHCFLLLATKFYNKMIHYKLVVKVQTLSNLQLFSLDRAHNKHLLSYFHNLPLHEYAYLSCSQVEFQRTIDQIYAKSENINSFSFRFQVFFPTFFLK